MGRILKPRNTCACGRECAPRNKRCDICKRQNPSRHARLPRMFCSIDGEGAQDGGNRCKLSRMRFRDRMVWDEDRGEMKLVSFSFGREDGTSDTLVDATVPEFLLWLVDNLTKHYTNAEGVEYIQVPIGFHLGWDTSVIAKHFLTVEDGVTTAIPGMRLVRKVQLSKKEQDNGTILCGEDHENIEDCEQWQVRQAKIEAGWYAKDEIPNLMHTWDRRDVAAVLAFGGETDLAALHIETGLAMAFSQERRLYIEHRPNGDRYEDWRRLDIHDNGSSFVGGLEANIERWKPTLSDEQRAAIAWGKQERKHGTFGEIDRTKIAAYSEAECVAHARMSRQLLDLIRDAAHVMIDPEEMFGSGSIAGATLKRFRVPTRNGSKREKCPGTHKERTKVGDIAIDDIALLDYFGGKIETPVIGMVVGMVDELDINSAYPSKMINLPCMRVEHGEWKKKRGAVDLDDVIVAGHVLVSWDIPEGSTSTPPFMHRDIFGRVSCPLSGSRVWVSLAEYKAAMKRFPESVVAHHTVWWEQTCECENPLTFLQEMYDARIDLKNQLENHTKGSEEWQSLNCRQEVLKLVINSIYGKLAQQRPTMGKYTNMHWASYITGATRAQVNVESWLREAQGGVIVYQHTDSDLSQGGDPQDGGTTLGAWGREKRSANLVIIQPGLATSIGAFVTGEETEYIGGKTANRGAGKDPFTEAVREWLLTQDLSKPPSTWGPLTIYDEQMITLSLAMTRNTPEKAGSFQGVIKTVQPGSNKRDMSKAKLMPGQRTAWVLPPLLSAGPAATMADITQYQNMFYRRSMRGIVIKTKEI